jgi:hypothetical protein
MTTRTLTGVFRPGIYQRSVTLLKKIIALKVTRSESKTHALELAELPSGAVVEVRGKGLDDQTLTVHWNRAEYLVFTRDLDGV